VLQANTQQQETPMDVKVALPASDVHQLVLYLRSAQKVTIH
jgi:hypothetical protein